MIACPRDVFRDAIAHGVIAKAGGKKVVQPKQQAMSGYDRDGNRSTAEVLEYATPDGAVIARLVKACGQVEAWLRADLATETLVARADAFAEVERIKAEMVSYIRAQHRALPQRQETYVLSSALIHAAARRQAKLGGLYDMNSHGDKIRGNLVAALDRAVKAEAGE